MRTFTATTAPVKLLGENGTDNAQVSARGMLGVRRRRTPTQLRLRIKIQLILTLSSQELSASLPRLGTTTTAATAQISGGHLTTYAQLRQVMMSKIFATQSIAITTSVSQPKSARALLTATVHLVTASVHLVKTATTKLPSCTRKNLPARTPGENGIRSAVRTNPMKWKRRSVIKSTLTTTRLLH